MQLVTKVVWTLEPQGRIPDPGHGPGDPGLLYALPATISRLSRGTAFEVPV